ncbi:MAG: hypothetical protein E6G57_07920 [Actinobacteria bacterium]|nr:MAG: hypothetical protein E6G57_07920 [Actinomycetota bacterium]
MVSTTISRWRGLPTEHRRWIVVNALVVTAFTNFVLNGLIAWLSVRTQHAVPIWGLPAPGKTNVMTDTVGTFFFLPLFTCAMCTTAVWAQVRAGRLPRLEALAVPRRLAHGRLRRGAVLGVVTAAALSPIAIVVLAVGQLGSVSTTQFVLYKMILGVLLGAVVTPVIAVLAMADHANGEPQVA